MIKEFYLVISMVLALAGFMIVHYMNYDGMASQTMLSSVAKVTRFSSPSLSVAYYEPRVLFYEDAINPAYPQMQTINRMDLVYAE